MGLLRSSQGRENPPVGDLGGYVILGCARRQSRAASEERAKQSPENY